MSQRKYVFWFHYNKPESLKRGRNVLTVHYRKRCLMVEHIDCKVPITTKHRSAQPRCVLTGKGVVTIDGNTAIIE